MANDKPETSSIVAAFVNTWDDKIILCGTGRLGAFLTRFIFSRSRKNMGYFLDLGKERRRA